MTNLGERDLQVEGRLAKIEVKLEELKNLILQGLVTQLKDHGKRIAALERRAIWKKGWIAGVAAASSILTAVLTSVIMKLFKF